MKFSAKFKADGVRKMFKDLEKEFKEGADGAKAGYYEGERIKSKDGKETPLIADIGLWNTFGVPQMKIPQRPFMQNAEVKIQKRAPKIMQKGLDDGKTLNKIMAEIAEDMRSNIINALTINSNYEKNADITIYGGWMKNKISGKPFKVEGKGEGKNPLYNNGDLVDGVHIAMVKNGKEKPLGK